MLKKESNQLVAITNISESLNIQRDTRQHSEQTKVSVHLNKPLGSTHVTTTVSNIAVCYNTTILSIFKLYATCKTKTCNQSN